LDKVNNKQTRLSKYDLPMGLEIYLNPLLVEESEGQPIVDGMKSLAAGSDILSIRTLKKKSGSDCTNFCFIN